LPLHHNPGIGGRPQGGLSWKWSEKAETSFSSSSRRAPGLSMAGLRAHLILAHKPNFFFIFFFGGTWGMNSGLRVHKADSLTTWAIPPAHFVLVILEMKSCKLFVRAGLELQSSQSQPPK
jgi:hypothetical protein